MKRQRKEAAEKDERFAGVSKDKRFKSVSKNDAKVKLDPRFKPMLEKDEFRLASTRDKYGRKVEKTTGLEKFYDVDEEADNDDDQPPRKKVKYDDAVPEEGNEQLNFKRKRKLIKEKYDEYFEEDEDEESGSDSDIGVEDLEESEESQNDSNDDDSDSDSDSSDSSDREPDVLPESESEEVPQGEPTKRLSVIDIDWDRIRSMDIWMAFQSFLPPGGVIKSVAIYKSDMGKQMMEEEEKRGPPVFTVETRDVDDPDDGPLSTMSPLYFYCVVLFAMMTMMLSV